MSVHGRFETCRETPKGAAELDGALSAQASAAQSNASAKSSGLDDRDAEAIARDLEYDFAADSSLPDLIDARGAGAQPIKRKIDLEEGARGLTVTGVALFIGKVVVAVIRRYRSGTAHDPLPTAVEELLRTAYLADAGKFAWDAMKTKAQRMATGHPSQGQGHGCSRQKNIAIQKSVNALIAKPRLGCKTKRYQQRFQ
jgi:hypothetical protein